MTTVNWKIIYNDDKGSLNNLTYCDDAWGDELDMEGYVPRIGEYIVAGDQPSNDRGKYKGERQVFIVKNIFWNLRRKDIEIYLQEVDKETYPLYKGL